MTQYNSFNVKLSNSQLNKLKPATKNESDVALRISLSTVGNPNDNTNFPHKLLLTVGKLQIFVKLFLTTYQEMLNFQKLNY